jgi:glycosyltransferase involved in cell wall biosynthesis
MDTSHVLREPPPSPCGAPALWPRNISGWLETHLGPGSAQAYLAGKVGYQFLRHEAPKIRPIVHAIRTHKIDLVHVNTGLRHGKPAIVAAQLTKTPCICHVRMFDVLTRFDRAFARFVDRFVYISTSVAQGYTKQGVPQAKGAIVHNAVDLDDFGAADETVAVAQETDTRDQVRAEFGWMPQQRLVGVVGRLDWWKGHEYFLEAMAEAVQHIPNLKGLIVGEPQDTPRNQEYCRNLRSLTQSLGLENTVLFAGFRSDVPRLMSAMDVVVLPSSSPEPFGRVVIEGMAAGKPVVATAAGGVLDIIEDGISGSLVPSKDATAMAAAIVELLSNSEKAHQMGQAARRRVELKFTLQRQVAAIQQIYDTTLADRPSVGRQLTTSIQPTHQPGEPPCA